MKKKKFCDTKIKLDYKIVNTIFFILLFLHIIEADQKLQ